MERYASRHAYFTRGGTGNAKNASPKFLYWDYQKMRREYGKLEYGMTKNIGGMPASPHPFCMEPGSTKEDMNNLVAFLLTL